MNTRRFLIQRWIPLLILLPLVYLSWPIFWKPLDYRFYNYYQSLRSVPAAQHVAVVEIDDETASSVFDKPLFPLSRHVDQHARVTRQLHRVGARMIVFDLELSENLFDTDPAELADAFRECGTAVLVMSLPEVRITSDDGHSTTILRGTVPHPLLTDAAAAVCIADAPIDPDGVLRRFKSAGGARQLGIETLPEYISKTRVRGRIPIDFPSSTHPIPSVSYRDVLIGRDDVLATLSGRIVFVGSTLDASGDYIVTPAAQTSRLGTVSYTLPGVTTLAAISETLLRGTPLRDARWTLVLIWNLIWCIGSVSLMPRGRAITSVIVFVVISLIALTATGLMHTQAGIVFPAGLLLGCLVFSGGFTIVYSHLQTSRALVKTLKASRDELEQKVQERTEDLSKANTELTDMLETLRKTQAQLIQAEKMASLGNLAAGVAHEINNPIGAVSSASNVILRCIEKIMKRIESSDSDTMNPVRNTLTIIRDSNSVITTAGHRIATIVGSLKNFARLDEADLQTANIHEGIDSTITLLQHEIGDSIKIKTHYADVPRIKCYPGELNQVFMNMLKNAIKAIVERGTITITTSCDAENIYVEIADTGVGIASDHLEKIFDPGFTTQGVQVGTGLGLSICYNIIKKHEGEIRVKSIPGTGSTFTVVLPIHSG